MTQFSLDTMTTVTISNVNIRAELAGKEPVPAADIDFKLTAPNTILSEFHGALRDMLYQRAEAGDAADAQQALDGVEPVSDMPVLRCAVLKPLRLKRDYIGYGLVIDYGLGGKSNIEIGDCKVNSFEIDPKEGGSVEVEFRVQASRLTEQVLGKLAALVRHEVSITLTPPETKQEAIDASSSGDWPFPQGGETDGQQQIDATDAFVDAHAEA